MRSGEGGCSGSNQGRTRRGLVAVAALKSTVAPVVSLMVALRSANRGSISSMVGKRKRTSSLSPSSSAAAVSAASSAVVSTGSDRLTELPDDVLHTILSLLPIKDAARTAALCTGWRRLWPASTLNLTGDSLADHLIPQILSSHTGPINRCRIPLYVSPETTQAAETLVKTLAHRDVHDITLYCYPGLKLPATLLNCESLQALELHRVSFPLQILASLPRLRVLRIHGARLSDGALGCLLANSPLLETLVLGNCRGLKQILVRSSRLRRLEVVAVIPPRPEELIVEYAPNLERLVLDERFMVSVCVRIVRAPKLGQLGCVNAQIRKLELGETRIQRRVPSSFGTLMPNLKIITIKVDFNDFHQNRVTSELLRCSPCLETLNVLIVNTNSSHDELLGYWNRECSFNCLQFHLKSVKLEGFLGHENEIGFAKFLISRSRMLTSMDIWYSYIRTERWIETKRAELCLENRASSDVKVVISKAPHHPHFRRAINF